MTTDMSRMMSDERPKPIGPHDLAGQDAGIIDQSTHDLAHWERVVDAIVYLLLEKGVMGDVAQLRAGIEELGPNVYEQLSYYERWAASAAKASIDAGVVSKAELERRIDDIRQRSVPS